MIGERTASEFCASLTESGLCFCARGCVGEETVAEQMALMEGLRALNPQLQAEVRTTILPKSEPRLASL